MTTDRLVRGATCLGCGCTCDDIEVTVREGRLASTGRACDLGRQWFGDGRVPARVRVAGEDAPLETAIERAAAALAAAARPLVYLAPDLSCEAQREALALADLLRAHVDSVTSATMRTVLAAQERGRASATLGEIRHRADTMIFWAIDPSRRYPRYWTRYAPEPAGLYAPEGRRSRRVIAVDVDAAHGPGDADHRVAVTAEDEASVLTSLAAAAHEDGDPFERDLPGPIAGVVNPLVEWLRDAKYVAIVADAEPDPEGPAPDGVRASGLIALAQALNAPARCGLSLLRGGGNRSGADAVLTWQTGFPAAVDFARGFPAYRPHDGTALALLQRGESDLVVLIGGAAGVPGDLAFHLADVTTVAIGPRASEGVRAAIAIDTGVAGIHHAGLAVRMDDVPLPLERLLEGPPATEAIVRALTERIVTTQGLCP